MGITDFFRFGAKSARRATVDYGYMNLPKSNPDAATVCELKEYIQNDPELATAMRKFVNAIITETPRVIRSEKGTPLGRIKKYNQQLTSVRFNKVLRNMIYSLIYDGNAYAEVRFSGSTLKEMYNIDADSIKPVFNETGEVVYWEQQISTSETIRFEPEEILHISLDNLQTQEWGMSFIKSLKDTLKQKMVAEDYLQWLIQQNKTAPVVAIKSAQGLSDEQKQQLNDVLKFRENYPNKYKNIGLDKEDSIEIIRIFTFDDIEKLLNYIETRNRRVYNTLMIPQSLAGQGDSDRSYSESQERDYQRNVKAIQHLVTEELNFEFLDQKLGWKDVEFCFFIITPDQENELLKNASTLIDKLGFTQESAVEYLKERGFKLPQLDELYIDKIELLEKTTQIEQDSKNMEDYESRQPRDSTGVAKNEAKMKDDIKAGVNTDARN